MERVAFLVEETGERVSCLLNPESVLLRRRAGIRARQTAGGLVTGSNLLDDPLLFTGGGWTELTLNLLFDVTLEGSSIQSEDVRDLTGPLWELSENSAGGVGRRRPPQVRFFWGKSWNIPGVIAAIAERLDYFSPEGAPRRSWLRLRLVRAVPDEQRPRAAPGHPSAPSSTPGIWVQQGVRRVPADGVQVHEVLGTGGGGRSERLDTLAYRYLGDPSQWRRIARFNRIDNPLSLAPGMRLEIPLMAEREAG